ncbi:MAG: RluA family pseudouridine synthase [Lentisphaeria bacterium]|nr:RluA family pseudouridine synthase [Lentisphaeria bacterium]
MDLPFEPLERVVQVQVPQDAAGAALIDYLSERYNYLDREQWQHEISKGNLEVNGIVASESTPLAANDSLFFQAKDLFEQDVSFDISILDETDDYIIINKPGNLPCHPAGRFFNHTLWAWLKQARHIDSIHFVSRLDRETSGIVFVAKNPRFAANAAKMLHSLGIETHKQYLVLVHGHAPKLPFTANGWLMKDENSPVEKKKHFSPIANDGDSDVIEIPEDDEAVTAQTDFRFIGTYRPPMPGECQTKFIPDENGEFSLLEATLHTGRTHQIRATLCSLGYPIVGDKLYGVDDTIFLKFAKSTLERDDWKRLILPTQALHAWRLQIPRLHINVEAPPSFI